MGPRRGADSGALSTRAMGFGKSLTATEAINRLKENDPSFTKCDLGNNAVRSAAPSHCVPCALSTRARTEPERARAACAR